MFVTNLFLNTVPGASAPQRNFFAETMVLLFASVRRKTYFALHGLSGRSEGFFRGHFNRDEIDWLSFNAQFVPRDGRPVVLAIDPSFISKSGEGTPGVWRFWSGCAGTAKRGLEILGIAALDVANRTASHLLAVQTRLSEEQKKRLREEAKARGERPKAGGRKRGKKSGARGAGKGKAGTRKASRAAKANKTVSKDTLITLYLNALRDNLEKLQKISKAIVADAYFSKATFVSEALGMGFHVVSRFRDDACLRYLAEPLDPQAKRGRGRPRKYKGKVDVKNPDPERFERVTVSYREEDDTYRDYELYTAVVNAKGLKMDVRVVVVDMDEPGKKTQRRKIFFSTDTAMSAAAIFMTYRSRFQIEYLYRDGKGYTGLCDSQSRTVNAMHNSYNFALTALNVARAFMKERGIDLSIGSFKMLVHNAYMIGRFIETFAPGCELEINEQDFKELLLCGTQTAT